MDKWFLVIFLFGGLSLLGLWKLTEIVIWAYYYIRI